MVLEGSARDKGFGLTCKNEDFKCGFITYSEQYACGRVHFLKRHKESAEVFVLLNGKATLLTGEPSEGQYKRTDLQIKQTYCIPSGTWHYLVVSEDALVFVVENSKVSIENTDSLDVWEQGLVLEV